MDSRKYNSINAQYNERWSSNALKISLNPQGPDLINDRVFVEVKFGLARTNWTLLGYQFNYHLDYADRRGFLLLGLYSASKRVEDIDLHRDDLSKLIKQREAWLTCWDHTLTLKIGPKVKKKNQYKYLDHIHLPKTVKSVKHTNGVIHICEDVDLELFNL